MDTVDPTQPQKEQLQLKEENLVSFNPNDHNLRSPVLSNALVMENIRNFTQQKMQQEEFYP